MRQRRCTFGELGGTDGVGIGYPELCVLDLGGPAVRNQDLAVANLDG
jgi:hypothetical protein